MIIVNDIIKKYTRLPMLVAAVYEYDEYYEPVIININNIEITDTGLPLLINKKTGEETTGFLKGKYKIIINQDREQYREKLNKMSLDLYKMPFAFPDEENRN